MEIDNSAVHRTDYVIMQLSWIRSLDRKFWDGETIIDDDYNIGEYNIGYGAGTPGNMVACFLRTLFTQFFYSSIPNHSSGNYKFLRRSRC
eukprot:12874256-Ditylum_brightwellii.AAC.2